MVVIPLQSHLMVIRTQLLWLQLHMGLSENRPQPKNPMDYHQFAGNYSDTPSFLTDLEE